MNKLPYQDLTLSFFFFSLSQFVIFKTLSYCFKETTGFDVKAWFASRPVLHLVRWYSKLGDITKEFWQKAIRFHGTVRGLKITNCSVSLFLSFSLSGKVKITNHFWQFWAIDFSQFSDFGKVQVDRFTTLLTWR